MSANNPNQPEYPTFLSDVDPQYNGTAWQGMPTQATPGAVGYGGPTATGSPEWQQAALMTPEERAAAYAPKPPPGSNLPAEGHWRELAAMSPEQRDAATASYYQNQADPNAQQGGAPLGDLMGIMGIANMAAGIGRQVYEALRPGPKKPPARFMPLGGNPMR